MPNLPLPGLMPGDPEKNLPGDPENLLSHDARQKIAAALIEAERIRKQTLSALEIRHRAEASSDVGFMEYLASGSAFVDFTESRMQAARVVLRAEAEEYGKLGMSDRRFRETMREKIEGAVYSFEFSATQRDALEAEFLWPSHGDSQAQFNSDERSAADRVRAFMEQRGLKNPAFAKLIGMSVRQVGSVLAGAPVGKETKVAVAKALGTTPEELFRQ